jgi:methylmalonyl-CoA epimerase
MIIGIDHIAIAVHDVDRAAAFYEDNFQAKSDPIVQLEERNVNIKFVYLGNDKIELLAPRRPEGTLYRFLTKRGEGLYHICLEVDDIKVLLQRLKENGVQLVDNEPWESPHGLAAFIKPLAANNVSIELRQKVGEKEK